LENLLALCTPLVARAHKTNSRQKFLDFSSFERSYPESLISGKIIIEFKNSKTPMVNAEGHILGLPLESAEEIIAIQPVTERKVKNVLTVENKETFYALGMPQKSAINENFSHYDCMRRVHTQELATRGSPWGETEGMYPETNTLPKQPYPDRSAAGLVDCFLYTGGYPNRAAAVLIKILASCGFSFYHAGDLDPDGILILQNIQDIAEKPVIPVRMDPATFDQYRTWGRTLTKPMLRQIEKIREETLAIPCLTALLQRIKETGSGVEQEIIDYR
jgi:hypothetical protein